MLRVVALVYCISSQCPLPMYLVLLNFLLIVILELCFGKVKKVQINKEESPIWDEGSIMVSSALYFLSIPSTTVLHFIKIYFKCFFLVMLQTIIQSITLQRAITQKVPKIELWFLCTSLPLNALFFWTRFHLISLGVLEKCSWQEVETDGHTDEQFHYYRPPFVGHKK